MFHKGPLDGPCECGCHDNARTVHIVPCCYYSGQPRGYANRETAKLKKSHPAGSVSVIEIRGEHNFAALTDLIVSHGINVIFASAVNLNRNAPVEVARGSITMRFTRLYCAAPLETVRAMIDGSDEFHLIATVSAMND